MCNRNCISSNGTTTILPIRPETTLEIIFTQFWVDNFDNDVDNKVGGGSIHTTHLMAFQNGTVNKNANHGIKTVPRTKSRKIFLEDVNIDAVSIDRKKNPPKIFTNISNTHDSDSFDKKHVFVVPEKTDVISTKSTHI